MLEHALSKVDFLVDMGIYMLPSDLNLNIGKTKGSSNKILVSSTDIKIGSNRGINKDHKKLPPTVPGMTRGAAHESSKTMKSTDKPVKDRLTTQHEHLKMYTENHNADKLILINDDKLF